MCGFLASHFNFFSLFAFRKIAKKKTSPKHLVLHQVLFGQKHPTKCPNSPHPKGSKYLRRSFCLVSELFLRYGLRLPTSPHRDPPKARHHPRRPRLEWMPISCDHISGTSWHTVLFKTSYLSTPQSETPARKTSTHLVFFF